MTRSRAVVAIVAIALGVLIPQAARTADHNDPNAINSIFSDIPTNGADLYDMFGFPVSPGGDRVVIALTFGAVPSAGVLDPDLLYRILISPAPRVAFPMGGDPGLDGPLAGGMGKGA